MNTLVGSCSPAALREPHASTSFIFLKNHNSLTPNVISRFRAILLLPQNIFNLILHGSNKGVCFSGIIYYALRFSFLASWFCFHALQKLPGRKHRKKENPIPPFHFLFLNQRVILLNRGK